MRGPASPGVTVVSGRPSAMSRRPLRRRGARVRLLAAVGLVGVLCAIVAAPVLASSVPSRAPVAPTVAAPTPAPTPTPTPTGTLVSIAVTPLDPTIPAGVPQQFAAIGTYSDASTANITSQVSWTSATTTVATIGSGGLASAVSPGTSTISASAGSTFGSTTLTVSTATLVSIAVTPPSPSIPAGTSQQFTATGTYSDASTVDLTSVVTWASATPSVATIGPAGLATGMSPGTSIISATQGGVAGSAALAVTALTGVTAITAGGDHTCAILSGGNVACWGRNNYGQLGNGTTTGSSVPVLVSGISGVTAIAAGGSHTCAIVAGGDVVCWGFNDAGELGNGTTSGLSPNPTPVAVSAITGATAIAAGLQDTCAVLGDGSIDCWGYNGQGELGNGTFTGSSTPVAVNGVTAATQIAVGGDHTCALLLDGSVDCWGNNGNGQLGDGQSNNVSAIPVQVSGLAGATAMSAGAYHSCALVAGGVECWGSNIDGELGNETLTDSSTPVSVAVITGATAIAAGGDHTCALASGGVECWGSNVAGELGNGTTTYSSTPVPVSGITGVGAIASGDYHSCGLVPGGGVECWGSNGYGTLGNGWTTDSSTPVAVTGLSAPDLTPTGTNVAVTPASSTDGTTPVTVTFGDVTGLGSTTLTTSTTAPALPGGFAIGSPPVYYDLQTTATYTTPITVCISYTGITPAPTTMLHYDSTTGTWADVTTSIDTTSQVICGSPPSLSPFALVNVFSYPASGAFVVGDQSAIVGATVTWWSPRWSSANGLSGGTAPSAFKGFAGTLSSTPPIVRGTWSTVGGQGASPPLTVPTYMAVIVTGAVTKSGSMISGSDARIAVVQVDPGYNPVTGTPGTGTLLWFLP